MAQDRILGEQLNLNDVTSDIAEQPVPIGNKRCGCIIYFDSFHRP